MTSQPLRWAPCALLLISCLPLSGSELLLLAGSPTPKYNQAFQSILYSWDGQAVKQVLELSGAGTATDWIGVSVEHGYAVLVTMGPPSAAVTVLNGRDASVAKHCLIPETPGRMTVAQWLIDVPSRGLTYVRRLGGEGGSPMQAISLDPAVSCDDSFSSGSPPDIRFIHSDGAAGIADIASAGGIDVYIEPGGQIVRRISSSTVTFDQIVKPELVTSAKPSIAYLAINTSDLMALSVPDAPGLTQRRDRTLLLRKRDMAWITMPRLSQRTFWLRAFGPYVTVVESNTKDPSGPKNALVGQARRKATGTGPSIHDRLADSSISFPGRLHIFDINTEKVHTIQTEQSDSEILLIESGVVYYRVATKLFEARIGQKGIEPSRLLTDSEVINDVHWAFMQK